MTNRAINPNTLPKMNIGTLNAPAADVDDEKRTLILARLNPVAQVAHADKSIDFLRSYAKTMRLDRWSDYSIGELHQLAHTDPAHFERLKETR